MTTTDISLIGNILAETSKAVLFSNNDYCEMWIPKKAITETSVFSAEYFELKVGEWFFKMANLLY